MKKKNKKYKPTGSIKQVNVANTPSGMPIVLPQEEFSFPQDKEAAEEVAMKALFEELKQDYVHYKFESYSRHPQEDGPDFNVSWDGKEAFVELTELAPLSGPYKTAKRVFTVKEMSDTLVGLAKTKFKKYKDRGFSPLFLLIYITDDAFYVVEEVLLVVAKALQVDPPTVFEAIFFVSFWANGKPHMSMMFPHHENLLSLNVEPYLEKQVINPASSQFKILSEDPNTNSIIVRQYLPAGADISKMVDSVKAKLPGLDILLNNKK